MNRQIKFVLFYLSLTGVMFGSSSLALAEDDPSAAEQQTDDLSEDENLEGAEGSDAEGTDDEGTDDEGTDAEGSDAEGSDAEGSDAEGSDAEGIDDEGTDDEDSDDEDSDDENDAAVAMDDDSDEGSQDGFISEVEMSEGDMSDGMMASMIAFLIAGFCAILGIWLDRDKSRPVIFAWMMTCLIATAVIVGIAQSYLDSEETEKSKEELSRMLEMVSMIAAQTGDDELAQFVDQQMQEQAEANPTVVEEVQKRQEVRETAPTAAPVPKTRTKTKAGKRGSGSKKRGSGKSSDSNKSGKGKDGASKGKGGKGKSSSPKSSGKSNKSKK